MMKIMMDHFKLKNISKLCALLCLLIVTQAISDVQIKVIIGGDPEAAGSLKSITDATSADGDIFYIVDPEAVKVRSFNQNGEWHKEFGEKGKEDGQLWEPFGIAIHSGKLYVTDRKLDRISVFDLTGRFLYSFAQSGGTPGKLDTPTGITISDQERVYVVDSGNHRVSVFTTEGIFLRNLAQDSLREPMYIAQDNSGVLYVSDPKAKAVYAVDDAGSVSEVIVSSKEWEILPSGIAVDEHGSLLLMDQDASKVYMLKGGGGPTPLLGSVGKNRGQFKEPMGMKLVRDDLLIADAGNYRLQVLKLTLPDDLPVLAAAQSLPRVKLLNVQKGKPYVDVATDEKGKLFALMSGELVIHSLQPDGTFLSELAQLKKRKKTPIGTSIVAGNGKVFVSDVKNNEIHCFTYDGKHKFSFGEKGKDEGYLYGPTGMALQGNKLFVAEKGNKRVQMFSADGVAIGLLEAPGQGFKEPVDVAVSSSSGKIFVADKGLDVVFVYSKDGKLTGSLSSKNITHQIENLAAIDVDQDGRVFVLSGKGSERVRIFSEKGDLKMAFGAAGTANAELTDPSGLAVVRGSIFIADQGNERLVAYSFKEVTAPPKDLTLIGDEESSTITWKGGGESFLKGFKVYGLNSKGERQLITETTGEEHHISYSKDGKFKRFSISSYSREGLESPQAGPVIDHFQLGLALYRAGKMNKAIPKFEAAIRENSKHGKALEYLGKVHLAVGNDQKAFKAFTKLSNMKDFRQEGFFNLGVYHYSKGENDQALEEFERAQGVRGASSLSLMYMARIYFERQDLKKAVDLAQEASLTDTKNPEIYEILGLAFHGQRLFGKAEKNFNTAIGLDPKNSQYYRELALVYIDEGNPKTAIEKLKKAKEIAPEDMDVQVALGEAMLLIDEYNTALTYAKDVIRAEPKRADAYLLKAKAEAKLGKTEDVVVSLEKALSIDPESEEALIVLGSTYLDLGNLQEANKNLDKLIELYPDSADARLAYARAKLKMGFADEAIDNYQKAVDLNPLNAPAHLEMGKVLVKRKEFERAVGPLKHALELAPGSINALLELGKAYTALGKAAEAMDVYEEAININPDWAAAHFELGQVYLSTMEYEKAIRELKLAAYIEPQNGEYKFILGKAYMAVENAEAAITVLTKASEINPSEEYKRELSLAYQLKDKLKQSDSLPPIEVAELTINPVFAALHKYYVNNPIGSFVIKNNSSKGIYKIKTTVTIKTIMDYPAEVSIPKVTPRSSQKVEIVSTFNDKLLLIKEDRPAIAEVEVVYYKDNQPNNLKLSVPFTIHGKNALTWAEKGMVAAFSTPTDWPVSEFARGIMALYVDEGPVLPQALVASMQMFDALGAYGMSYIPDPNSPFSVSSKDHTKVDYVQFPRETLKARSGDCDDLVVLMISLMENIGIETAMVDIPGHVFMIVNTGLSSSEINSITSNPDHVVVIDNTIWLPIEMTMVGKPFTSAWIFAAEQYKEAQAKGEVNLVYLHKAWKSYSPASLPLDEWSPELPKKTAVDALYQEEKKAQSSKIMERESEALKKAITDNPDDIKARLKLGILYANRGYPDKSRETFEAILSRVPESSDALNNLANLAFMAEDFPKALDLYKRAEAAAPSDAIIKINISMCLYRAGEIELARGKFKEATEIDPDLETENSELKSYLFE